MIYVFNIPNKLVIDKITFHLMIRKTKCLMHVLFTNDFCFET